MASGGLWLYNPSIIKFLSYTIKQADSVGNEKVAKKSKLDPERLWTDCHNNDRLTENVDIQQQPVASLTGTRTHDTRRPTVSFY